MWCVPGSTEINQKLPLTGSCVRMNRICSGCHRAWTWYEEQRSAQAKLTLTAYVGPDGTMTACGNPEMPSVSEE